MENEPKQGTRVTVFLIEFLLTIWNFVVFLFGEIAAFTILLYGVAEWFTIQAVEFVWAEFLAIGGIILNADSVNAKFDELWTNFNNGQFDWAMVVIMIAIVIAIIRTVKALRRIHNWFNN